jgi:DNA-binding CsgD family transcriptional regulator
MSALRHSLAGGVADRPDGMAILRALEVLEPVASADDAAGLSHALFDFLPRLLDLRSMVIFHDIVASSRPAAAFSLNTVDRSSLVWQEMYEINPIRPLVEARGQAAVVTLSQAARRIGDIRSSPFYSRYMTVDGFDKQAVVPIRHNGRLRSAISIRRDSRHDPFSPGELDMIRHLQPFLTACFGRVWQREQADALAETVGERAEPLHPGVGFFDIEGAAISAGAAFWDGMKAWRGRADAECDGLPPEIRAAVRELAAGWAARRFDGEAAPYLKVRARGRSDLDVRVTLLQPLAEAPPIVEVAPGTPSRAAPTQGGNAALLKLTAREREVTALVLRGMTNAQIAHSLGKVEGTIKVQLHTIYRKLEVQNRSGLMLLLS